MSASSVAFNDIGILLELRTYSLQFCCKVFLFSLNFNRIFSSVDFVNTTFGVTLFTLELAIECQLFFSYLSYKYTIEAADTPNCASAITRIETIWQMISPLWLSSFEQFDHMSIRP